MLTNTLNLQNLKNKRYNAKFKYEKLPESYEINDDTHLIGSINSKLKIILQGQNKFKDLGKLPKTKAQDKNKEINDIDMESSSGDDIPIFDERVMYEGNITISYIESNFQIFWHYLFH